MIIHDKDALQQFLTTHNMFEECLVLDVSLVERGYSIDVVVDYLWDEGKKFRQDLDVPRLVVMRLVGVHSLHYSAECKKRDPLERRQLGEGTTELVWILAGDNPKGLSISLVGECEERTLEIDFLSMEVLADA